MSSSDGLDGKVALVTGGGDPLGRAAALALAARGVSVVVVGANERMLGETVGEIAYGGGKARHVVMATGADPSVAIERAVEVFGGIDLVVVDETHAAMFEVAKPRVREGGALVAIRRADERAKLRVDGGSAAAVELRRRAIACTAVSFESDVEPEAAAQLVVLSCSRAARTMSGLTLAVC